jgi:tRNA threonylcarbamoyladenosine biosynthesis protein TsaE
MSQTPTMSKIDRITNSPEETTLLGRELALNLTPPVLVLLSGDLGSGKTTLTKGIVCGLGAAAEEDVTSPTFTLVHVFKTKNRAQNDSPSKIYHVDLYRCEDFHDVETLALEDALSEPAIVIIEWSERFSLRSDWPRIIVRLEHVKGDTRHIVVSEFAQPEASAPQLSSRG